MSLHARKVLGGVRAQVGTVQAGLTDQHTRDRSAAGVTSSFSLTKHFANLTSDIHLQPPYTQPFVVSEPFISAHARCGFLSLLASVARHRVQPLNAPRAHS